MEGPLSPSSGYNPQPVGDGPAAIRTNGAIFLRLKTTEVKGTPAALAPISEGIMGIAPPGIRTGGDNPAPPKANGYVGSMRRRTLMLKTANATADPE
jgi:hypothetical protein